MASRRLAVGLTICLALSSAKGQARTLRPAERPALDWFDIDRSVATALLSRDLGESLRALPPIESATDPDTLLGCFDYFVRAGHRDQARGAIDRLAAQGDTLPTHVTGNIADFLIGREEWQLARQFMERFPRAEPGWGYVFIKRWAESGDLNEIDHWLEAQSAGERQYWFHERLRFRATLGTARRLVDSLAVDVRAHPTDVVRAKRYILAATSDDGGSVSVDWVGSVAKPASPLDAYDLGTMSLPGSPNGAVLLFERSMALEYTQDDQRRIQERMLRYSAMTARAFPPSWEATLRRWTTLGLISAYTASGRADRAQPLMEQVAAGGNDGIPPPGLSEMAGIVQRESGKRVIEQRIASAEAANKDSVKYWVARAAYYTGRRDTARASAAYERALRLAAPDRKGSMTQLHERYEVVSDYARLLGDPRRMSLIWRELVAGDLASDYATWLASDIARLSTDDRSLISIIPDAAAERRLWDYVGARRTWLVTEERLIQRLIEHLGPAERADRLTRVERLVSADVIGRARGAADAFRNLNEGARAIPLLRSYIATAPPGYDRNLASLTLFSTYLNHTTDWRAAEEAMAAARALLTPGETTDHVGQLAVMAAKAGATSDALRLWRIASNVDRADLRRLAALGAVSGMKATLIQFYEGLGREDPASWVPAAALRILRSS